MREVGFLDLPQEVFYCLVTHMTCKHLDYLTNYLYQTLVHYKPVKGSGEIDVDEIDDVYMYGSKKRADLREFRRGKGYGGGNMFI